MTSELKEINSVFDHITRNGTVDIPTINDHFKGTIARLIAVNAGCDVRSWDELLSIYAKNHLFNKN